MLVRSALTFDMGRYLKGVVIPSLIQTKHVQRVHTTQELTPEEMAMRLQAMTRSSRKQADAMSATVDVWRFQMRNRPTIPKPKQNFVFGEDVGVGSDWSHLNRRRQRSRVLSVTRDVRWLKKLERARVQGLRESRQQSAAPAAS